MRWANALRRTSYVANGAARILLFHRVAERTSLAIEPETSISPKLFRKVIGKLAASHIPLPLEALVTRLRRGESIERCVVVTFDDGFADNLLTALPILEEFQVPATVYVTTGFVGRDVLPLEYELSQIVSESTSLDFDGKTWKTESLAEKRECYESIRQVLKLSPRQRRDEVLEQLWRGLDHKPAPQEFEFLSTDQLRELDASPLITIGAHTHAHLVLTAVSAEQAKQDIVSGKQWLETQLGHPVLDFAYPYGAFDQSIQKCVGRIGCRTAVTTVAGPLSGRCELLALPRCEISAQMVDADDSLSRLLGP